MLSVKPCLYAITGAYFIFSHFYQPCAVFSILPQTYFSSLNMPSHSLHHSSLCVLAPPTAWNYIRSCLPGELLFTPCKGQQRDHIFSETPNTVQMKLIYLSFWIFSTLFIHLHLSPLKVC